MYDIDRMIPWEREVFIQLLIKHLREKEKHEKAQMAKYRK